MEKNTALFVMDMQASFLGRFPDATTLTGNVAKAIAHARTAKIPVIYVVVGFRPGAPEVSPNNKSFSAARPMFAGIDPEEMMRIEPGLAPIDGDIKVVKRRISAFAGSDLEVVIRALGIQHMVLLGISTSGVVLSTLREAADKDYSLTVLSDCCADSDEEVHRVLMTKIFPRHAEVVTVEAWAR